MTSVPTLSGYGPTGSSVSGSFTITPAATSGVQVKPGDLVFVAATTQATLANSKKVTAPAGWTTVIAQQGTGTGSFTVGLYCKRRETTDAAYTFTTSTVEASGVFWRTFWVSGVDAADMVTGTLGLRSVTGTATTAVGASLTTTVANSLALAVAFERTVAAETAEQMSVTGTGWTKNAATLVSDMSMVTATKAMPTPGPTGPVTFTWPNVQAVNAAAIQIGIAPAPDAPTGLAIKVSNGVTLLDTRLQVSDGTSLYTPVGIKKIQPGYPSVTEMLASPRFFCAHRGGSRDYPEMSGYAYAQSVLTDWPALEISIARTSDGVWFGLHDGSLDRTSLGTGGGTGTTLVPANMTWEEVQTYQIKGSSAANNPTQPDRPYMRWEELLEVYYDSHVIFVDPKVSGAHRTALLNMMDAQPGDPRERFVGKNYGVSGGLTNASGWAKDLTTRGYRSWGYFYEADLPNFAAYTGRWDILGMDYAASQSAWDALAAAAPGKIRMAHICPDQNAVNIGAAKGAVGFMCSGTKYISPA